MVYRSNDEGDWRGMALRNDGDGDRGGGQSGHGNKVKKAQQNVES